MEFLVSRVAGGPLNRPFAAESPRGCPIQAARFWPLERGFCRPTMSGMAKSAGATRLQGGSTTL